MVVGAGAAVVAVLVLGIVGSTWQAVRATRAEREQSRERQRAEQSEQKETEARKQAQAQAYASDMKLAQQAISEGNIGGHWQLLNRHRPEPARQTSVAGNGVTSGNAAAAMRCSLFVNSQTPFSRWQPLPMASGLRLANWTAACFPFGTSRRDRRLQHW